MQQDNLDKETKPGIFSSREDALAFLVSCTADRPPVISREIILSDLQIKLIVRHLQMSFPDFFTLAVRMGFKPFEAESIIRILKGEL